MTFWIVLLSLILIGFIGYKLLMIFFYPTKVQCTECLYTFRVHPKRAKTTCKYCDTPYILRADGVLVKRSNTLKPNTKTSKRLKKNEKEKEISK